MLSGSKTRTACLWIVMELVVGLDPVLTRLSNRTREYVDIAFTDHHHLAKRRALAHPTRAHQRGSGAAVSGAAQGHGADQDSGPAHDHGLSRRHTRQGRDIYYALLDPRVRSITSDTNMKLRSRK